MFAVVLVSFFMPLLLRQANKIKHVYTYMHVFGALMKYKPSTEQAIGALKREYTGSWFSYPSCSTDSGYRKNAKSLMI